MIRIIIWVMIRIIIWVMIRIIWVNRIILVNKNRE
jgi:hypothetical protein